MVDDRKKTLSGVTFFNKATLTRTPFPSHVAEKLKPANELRIARLLKVNKKGTHL